MAEKNKNNFKHTLNLPQTIFPMRANLSQNEPTRLKSWKTSDLYQQIQSKTKNRPRFIFHDGPPYANGAIHIGHLLNKVLKDFVVRSQLLLGKHCPYTPGWDCHGLPIEHKVMTELLNKKADKIQNLEPNVQRKIIRKECAKYAKKFIQLQSEQLQRLLTLADYDTPYLTMNAGYEKSVLTVFSKLLEKKLVFRQLKPVHWSIANQTALAEAELEYKDRKDPSIFVHFNACDSQDLSKRFKQNITGPISFTIWTTTPWTLPANLAIAVHNTFDYSLVCYNDYHFVIATERIPSIESHVNGTFRVLGTLKGEALLGLAYAHPFCNRTGKLTSADYVTLEDGTGLVHTAPGHGVDDYQTGLRENLDIYCPVQADGSYDNSVPIWLQGICIWDANKLIIDHLVKSRHMLFHTEFVHSYPHDWRSKTPVIFRSTEQWFIGVDKPSDNNSLRQLALNAIEKDIEFVPEWGKNRLRGMMESRPDWCISRQRSWGLPIPAFKLKDGSIFMTKASVEAVAEVFKNDGSDAWFNKTPEELLEHYQLGSDPDAPEKLELATLEKTYDIFDVWFESGSSWHAVLEENKLGFPADLYLEGSDQHRGWFHLSLLPSLGVHKTAPFKRILTHGFIVDKHGRKMSKSEGNALNVEDLLKKYGAEVCRWWVSSLAFENDIKVDLDFFNVASESYRKIRNTIRFLLSNLYDLDTSAKNRAERNACLDQISPQSINCFLLEKTTRLRQDVLDALETFKFKHASQLLYDFCNDTLSSFYCSVVKDTLYCDPKESPKRREAQYTMWLVLDCLLHLLRPFLPHTSEEAFSALTGTTQSIHLEDLPSFSFEADHDFPDLLKIRSEVLKKLEESKQEGIENPLDASVTLSQHLPILKKFRSGLEDLFGVSQVHLLTNLEESRRHAEIQIDNLKEHPRCERSWRRDSSVSLRDNGSWLSDRDYKAICALQSI